MQAGEDPADFRVPFPDGSDLSVVGGTASYTVASYPVVRAGLSFGT